MRDGSDTCQVEEEAIEEVDKVVALQLLTYSCVALTAYLSTELFYQLFHVLKKFLVLWNCRLCRLPQVQSKQKVHLKSLSVCVADERSFQLSICFSNSSFVEVAVVCLSSVPHYQYSHAHVGLCFLFPSINRVVTDECVSYYACAAGLNLREQASPAQNFCLPQSLAHWARTKTLYSIVRRSLLTSTYPQLGDGLRLSFHLQNSFCYEIHACSCAYGCLAGKYASWLSPLVWWHRRKREDRAHRQSSPDDLDCCDNL